MHTSYARALRVLWLTRAGVAEFPSAPPLHSSGQCWRVLPTAPTSRGDKQHAGGVLPTARLLATSRGDKQHAGGVLPTARPPTTLPTSRGDKQHSGGGVLPLPRRSLLKLLRRLLRSPLCLITRLLPHHLPHRLRQRRR